MNFMIKSTTSADMRPHFTNLHMYRCQNTMITEVQMGFEFQQASISSMRKDLSVFENCAGISHARAAVTKLQSPSTLYMSATTLLMRSMRRSARSSLGLCHTSTGSSSMEPNSFLSTEMSPTAMSKRVSEWIWTNKSD